MCVCDIVLSGTVRNSEGSYYEAQFGTSVDVSGDWMIVGAPFEYDNRETQDEDITGAAILYHREDGVWVQHQRLYPKAPNVAATGFAVAIDGDWCAVGSPDNEPGTDDGTMVDIYHNDGTGSWTLYHEKTGHDGWFHRVGYGYSLAMQAGQLVIGYPHPQGGSVIFTSLPDPFPFSDVAAESQGYSVAFSADAKTAVSGNAAKKTKNAPIGSVSVFTWQIDEYGYGGFDLYATVNNVDCDVGVALSPDGTSFALGCPSTDSYTGRVQIYKQRPGERFTSIIKGLREEVAALTVAVETNKITIREGEREREGILDEFDQYKRIYNADAAFVSSTAQAVQKSLGQTPHAADAGVPITTAQGEAAPFSRDRDQERERELEQTSAKLAEVSRTLEIERSVRAALEQELIRTKAESKAAQAQTSGAVRVDQGGALTMGDMDMGEEGEGETLMDILGGRGAQQRQREREAVSVSVAQPSPPVSGGAVVLGDDDDTSWLSVGRGHRGREAERGLERGSGFVVDPSSQPNPIVPSPVRQTGRERERERERRSVTRSPTRSASRAPTDALPSLPGAHLRPSSDPFSVQPGPGSVAAYAAGGESTPPIGAVGVSLDPSNLAAFSRQLAGIKGQGGRDREREREREVTRPSVGRYSPYGAYAPLSDREREGERGRSVTQSVGLTRGRSVLQQANDFYGVS
ncbi:hypothetical protein KIPB_005506 [Kipferlia bialata]|uniref:Uncharacterized protein n=1 Tax=Kipferlia bialata TaxID=797122 RepID=A0A9K3GIK2_9EUKA|nr:hypothetical protein KIPB_005506 [Kipferlia bialata]|eukprot:g5506.t1